MHVGMVREHWTWGVRKYSRLRFSIVHSTSKHLLCLLLVAQGPHGHKIQRSRSWRKAARERCTGWGVQEGNDQVQGQVHLHSLGITHSHILIYIYTRNAWALPQRCSVEGSHSQSNVVATLHSSGKINKGFREY